MDCSALLLIGSPDPALNHQLSHVLHLLYVVAIVLAALLLLSLGIALWAYRRHKEQEPRS